MTALPSKIALFLPSILLLACVMPGFSQESCSIYVDSDPTGAAVFLDSVNLGLQTPVRLDDITPGYHVIRLEKDDLEGGKPVTLQPNVISRILVPLSIKQSWLVITSEPAGAEVLIDGQPRGKTPFRFQAEGLRTYQVGLRSIGYLPEDRVIELGKAGTTTLDIPLRRYGEVLVESVPPDAEIYIDSEFLGRTPENLRLAEGDHIVILRRAGSSEYSQKIRIEVGRPLNLKAELVSERGSLTVLGLPDSAEVTIDGKPLGKAPIEGAELSVGPHWLHYRSEGYEPLKDPILVSVQGRHETVVTIAVQRKTRWNAIWRSMLFPGIGQIYSEQSLKGLLFLSAGALCIGSAAVLSNQASNAKSNYQDAHEAYAKAVSPYGIAAARENMISKHDLLRQKVDGRNALFVATAAVWTLGTLDQVLFSSTPWKGGVEATTRLSLSGKIDSESIRCQIALEW
jgi:hypothetical protein